VEEKRIDVTSSVADLGYVAFLTPGSGMGKKIPEVRNNFLG
jgi:hypothetical protein